MERRQFLKRDSWAKAALGGLPAALLVFALFWYWFAIADRFIVFLYYHDMRPRVVSTAPFSQVTSSRYWMAGLVASGAVMLVYTGINWLLGRLSKHARAPKWWRVWIVATILILLGVPIITMNAGSPVLPWNLTLRVTLSVTIGLLLAFLPGELAARNPMRLVWLAADGWGLALLLLVLPQLEDMPSWLSRQYGSLFALMGLFLALAGIGWLLLLSFIRTWLGVKVDGLFPTFLAGIMVCYLFLPFVHHTLGTDGYFYITDSDNFFAQSLIWQLLAWLAVVLLTWVIVRLRLSLRRRYASSDSVSFMRSSKRSRSQRP